MHQERKEGGERGKLMKVAIRVDKRRKTAFVPAEARPPEMHRRYAVSRVIYARAQVLCAE